MIVRRNTTKGKRAEGLEHSEPIPLNDFVSDAYIGYMHRRQDLSLFVEFYHRLAQLAIEGGTTSPNVDLHSEYIGHSAYFIENYVCRMSDIFDIYIEELVMCVCDVKQDFLSEKEYHKATQRLTRNGINNPKLGEIIDNACSWFARRGKTEIAQHFSNQLGFDVLNDVPEWKNVQKVATIRNQIVHGASLVNDKFLRQFPESEGLVSIGPGGYIVLNEKETMKLVQSIDASIMFIENKIELFVQLKRRNRYGHFWVARSVWNRPDSDS